MTDPLSKVPHYMRAPLDTRTGRYYQMHMRDIEEGRDDAEEQMCGFLKMQGAFFYSLDEVLSDNHVEQFPLSMITENDGKQRTDWAQAFVRTRAPDYDVRGGGDNIVKEFKATEACMKTKNPIASVNSKGHSSDAKKRIWVVDIFGIPYEDVKSSQIAHLLPDAADHAIEWYDVACWSMGLDPKIVEWEEIFRLLHGTKEGKKRAYGTGIRHFVANKARINQQEKLLDKSDPQMLILPIRTRRECLDWNGEGYDAIVLIGTDKESKSYLWALEAAGMTKVETMKASHASKTELDAALLLMRQMTFALVQSLVHFKPPQVVANEDGDAKEMMEDAIQKRHGRIQTFSNLMASKRVSVPKVGSFSVDEQFRGICKISFSQDKEKNLHLPPDPLLLVARAAVVWSVRKGFRLRASALPQDDYDWEFDAIQFDYLEQMARRRDVEQATDGMEVAMCNRPVNLESDDISAVSSQSSSTDSKRLENLSVKTSPCKLRNEITGNVECMNAMSRI